MKGPENKLVVVRGWGEVKESTIDKNNITMNDYILNQPL